MAPPSLSSSGLYLWRFIPHRPLHPEDGGSKVLRNVVILIKHYTAFQPRRPPFETSRRESLETRISLEILEFTHLLVTVLHFRWLFVQ